MRGSDASACHETNIVLYAVGLLDQTSLKERGPLQPSNRRAQAAEGPPDPMDIESHSKPTMTSSSGSTNVGQV